MCDNSGHIQRRRHSFGHELAHIFCGHFDTANTLDINTTGKETQLFYKGEYLPNDDSTPLHLKKEPWEIEADAQAWHYYRRFRDQFLQAEAAGRAVITV